MTTQTTYSAVVTLPTEARQDLLEHIDSYRRLREAEEQLQASFGDAKSRLATAVQDFWRSVHESIGPDFYDDGVFSDLDVTDQLDKALDEVLNYGYFKEGKYLFVDDYILIPLVVESEEFPRLAKCSEFQLDQYDPATGEATLHDMLRYDDDPHEDAEFSVYITLKVESEGPQVVEAVLEKQ